MDIQNKLLAEISQNIKNLVFSNYPALIWDSINKRLGINIDAPQTSLDVRGLTTNGTYIRVGQLEVASPRGDLQATATVVNLTAYNDATSLYIPLSLNALRTKLSSYMELVEITAPLSPATNSIYLYAADNGSGKTVLYAKFATGAAVQLAIEP